jgi:DNA-directed RNA polymerase subunit M/transcription elongation factor TFIIS
MVLGVVITPTGFSEINLPKTNDILEWIRKKNKNPTIQFQAKIYDNLTQRWISVFARVSEEDDVNPHVLPSPLDEETFGGSIFVFATTLDGLDDYDRNSTDYVSMTVDEYKAAYAEWDFVLSEDEEEEEEEEEEEIEEPRQFQVTLKPMVVNTRNVYVSNPLREKVLNNFKEYVEVAEDLECEVLNYVVSLCKNEGIDVDWANRVFWATYRSKAIYVYETLKTSWAEKLNSKEIDCKTFLELPAQEICPSRWKESMDKIIENDKKLYSKNTSASIVLFCSRCKKKAQCEYYQLQTRSADEPMTTFVSCLDCGKKWKF